MDGELVNVSADTQLKAAESELATAFKAKGMDSGFIADTLKTIATEAMTQNNKGDLIIDYHARLKAIQTMIKVLDKNYDRAGVNVNFFAPPSHDNLKY